MRKLKLQVQLSVDGFNSRPDGGLDWMTWTWDKELENYTLELNDTCNEILLGRKMADGFITHWVNTLQKPDDKEYGFAQRMVGYHKYVFSKTLGKSHWDNTEVVSGDIKEEVNRIKNNGEKKDVIVYGGTSFVASLIRENLIDEYYLFINPAAIGKGGMIFSGVDDILKLDLKDSRRFECGIVVNKYEPAK